MSDCPHKDFNAFVDVTPISKDVDGGPCVVYAVEVRVECRECKQPLEFVGVPHGMSFYRPTVNINEQTLHVPMVIPGQKVPEGLAGFSVTHQVFDDAKAVTQ